MDPITVTTFPRAGLLGNPSDQFGGKAIAFVFRNFSAQAIVEPADRFELAPGPDDGLDAPDVAQAAGRLRAVGCYGGMRLLRAALLRFATVFDLGSLASDDPRLRLRLRYRSDIPRQAGLSGSSAIVIAALRALAQWFDCPLEPGRIAELALAAELEDLGISAGPMDRVIQANGGVAFMDFAAPGLAPEPLDPASLPPLFVAWDPEVGTASGVVHADVRARWNAGDPEVRRVMALFPELAVEGRACLERGDHNGFRALVDRNFDTRASLYPIAARDAEMVAIGRKHGAAAKLCGSGGAVVGIPVDASGLAALERAYAQAGYRLLRPEIG